MLVACPTVSPHVYMLSRLHVHCYPSLLQLLSGFRVFSDGTKLKQNEAQSASAESTHKGVKWRWIYVTQVQQQRPETPTVTLTWHGCRYKVHKLYQRYILNIVQELCESRGGRPGLSVLTSLLVSVDVKIYCTVLRHWSQLVPNMSHDI